MEPAKESGAGAGLEKSTKIERDSKEKVLAAFKSAYSVLENTPEDQLTPQEKLMKQKVKAAKEKSIDQGKDTFTNKFKNDKTGDIFDDQEEGIPIEGLLEFLQKRVSQVPVNSKEWYDIINNAHILFRNSKGYFDLHRPAEESARWRGRLQQELEGTGRKRTDWIKATETLNNRLELVIPPAKEKARTKAKRVRASRAKIPVPAAPPEDTPPGTPVDVTPPAPAEGEPSPLPSAPPGTPPDNGEPQPTSTNQPGGNENQPRTSPSEIVVNIGGANEEVRKRGERVAQTRIEERSSEGFPTRLPQTKILRIGRLILHGLNPRNIPRILFNNSKEAYRQIWIDEHLQELRAANFGATNNLSQEAARRALAEVKEIRAAGQQVVERMQFGGIRAGETGPTEITGPFRDYVINQVIKPIIPRLTPLLANEAVNESQIQEIENEIQRKLTEYVRGHQNDQQITSFFGRNASDYGQLSEFYASDILETARLSIENGWAEDFAQGRLDDIVKVRIFRATWGEQTEIRRTLGDRMMTWAERNRVRGRIVNPATVGALAAGLTFLTIRGGLFKARAGVTVGAALVAGPLAIPIVGMASGALYAGLRNDWDLREQRLRVMREQEAGAGRETPRSGARREIIERSLLDMATPDQMINGGGQEIVAGGIERKSIEEMIRTDDLPGLLRRRGEIYARLDYAKLPVETRNFIFFGRNNPSGIGLIKYDEGRGRMEHGTTALLKQAMDIDRILTQNNRYTPDDLRTSVAKWNEALTENQRQMDIQFGRERLRSNLATAGGAAVIGGVIGLGFQEGIAVVGRLAGQDVGRTVIENAYQSLTGQGHAFEPTGEVMQGLYQNGGSADLGNNLAANIDPSSHNVNFINEATHQTVATGTLDAQGAVREITVGSGTDQAASQSLAQTLSHDGFTTAMHETTSSTPSLAQEITNAASQDSVKTVHLGNQLDVEIFGNSGKAVIHDLSNNTTITGTVGHNGSFTFDQSLNNSVNFSALHDKLAQAGFGVSEAHQAGKTVVDHIFQHNPDELRKMGIIETDKVDQNWNFHVLRPDIVAATGMHTHNELTLHFGQYMNEQGQWVTDKTGLLNFGGDVNGDLIPANLPDVPAQHDAILDALIAKNGPIHHNDMVFVVQLNDNREIMLGADNLGNAQMPQELIDPRTGQFVGVKAIAAAVLEGKDGSLVRAPNLFASGALPDGTTIHSLASVAVNSPTPPPTPIDIITANPPATPGSATHFVIDALPRYPETPVIIPFPMGPREPLGPPTRGELPRERITIPYYFGYGYENLPPRDAEFYRSRLSARLRENPNAVLDPLEEINDYLARQDSEYMATLEGYLNQVGMREPMDANTEAIVAIPVYALGEGQVIQGALEKYLLQVDRTKNKQAVDPNKVELIIFLNHPKPVREALEKNLGRPIQEGAEERVRLGKPEIYDTEEVIRQFTTNHPELKIRVMQAEFEQRPTWGNIIKPLYDAALIRSSRGGAAKNDPVIITNDVDLVNLSPAYVKRVLDSKAKDRTLDAWVGKIDMPNHGYENYPGFLVAERLFQYLDAQGRREEKGRTITQGRNTIMKSSIYSAIGGVNKDTDAGADTELGLMINFARNNPKTTKYLNVAWLETDPRRELGEWKRGVPLAFAWDSWGDFNMYGEDWRKRFNAPPQNPSKIDKNFLEREIYFEMERWGLGPDSQHLIRALSWLGLNKNDYHIGTRRIKHPRRGNIEVRTIVIDRLDGVVKNLQGFIGEKRWEKKERKILTEAGETPPALRIPHPGVRVPRVGIRGKVRGAASEVVRRGGELRAGIRRGGGAETSPTPERRKAYVEKMLSKIKELVVKNHPYFVENPPNKINLTDEERTRLESTLPFFVPGPNPRRPIIINKDVDPWFFDPIINADDRRLIKADNLTKGDSGLLALTAVSSETPEKQARLFNALAEAVVEIHQNNPGLLKKWYDAQPELSKDLFKQYDDDKRKFADKLTPPAVSFEEWQGRIHSIPIKDFDILPPNYTKTYLRWIEFLSHSVNIPELIKIAKSQPYIETTPTPPTTPARRRRLPRFSIPRPNISVGVPQVNIPVGRVGSAARNVGGRVGEVGGEALRRGEELRNEIGRRVPNINVRRTIYPTTTPTGIRPPEPPPDEPSTPRSNRRQIIIDRGIRRAQTADRRINELSQRRERRTRNSR